MITLYANWFEFGFFFVSFCFFYNDVTAIKFAICRPFTVTYSEEALYVADRSQSPFVSQNR